MQDSLDSWSAQPAVTLYNVQLLSEEEICSVPNAGIARQTHVGAQGNLALHWGANKLLTAWRPDMYLYPMPA